MEPHKKNDRCNVTERLICDYAGCNEPACYYHFDNPVCQDCFEREVCEYGEPEEDFEPIVSHDSI